MIGFLYILVLAIGLTCQSVGAPFVEVFGVRPDFLLVGIVFLGLHGPAQETILAAWIVGLAADLLTIEQFGFLGFSYALAALLVLEVREYLFRSRALTQFGVTAAVAMFVNCLWAAYACIRYESRGGIVTMILTSAIPASVLTAVWAVPVHRVLLWIARPLGLARPRRSYGRAPTAWRGHV